MSGRFALSIALGAFLLAGAASAPEEDDAATLTVIYVGDGGGDVEPCG